MFISCEILGRINSCEAFDKGSFVGRRERVDFWMVCEKAIVNQSLGKRVVWAKISYRQRGTIGVGRGKNVYPPR